MENINFFQFCCLLNVKLGGEGGISPYALLRGDLYP